MHKKFKNILIVSLLFASGSAFAQGFQPVFPGQSGTQLLQNIATAYTPTNVFTYGMSRDTLYAKILGIDDDSIRCVYSGHTLYLDPTQDPTQYIFLNGSTNGINTEHAYPQSKGAADGNARADMHHLYPSRIPVNEARGSLPYTDIPDAQTEKWFIKNQIFFSTPTQNKDAYSESTTSAFEPRESAKGNVARSVFYFYSIYTEQANAADPDFFNLQRATLCQWNAADPADSAELKKTWRIAAFQGTANPFVLDCTLANRCYCPEVAPNCMVSTQNPRETPDLKIEISPNPLRGKGSTLSFDAPFVGELRVRVFDTSGRMVAELPERLIQAGQLRLDLDFLPEQLPQGAVFVKVLLTDGAKVATGGSWAVE
jgi:hypothetical protein